MDSLKIAASKVKKSPKALKDKIDSKLNKDSKSLKNPDISLFIAILHTCK